MASHVTQGQLLIPNENLHIQQKKPVVDVSTNSLKTTTKKGGAAFGSRKALNDITNKSSIHRDVTSKKNTLTKEEFNVAEEMFLHNHKKCIKAQQTALNSFRLDLVLPGRDSLDTDGNAGFNKAKDSLDNPPCYPEPEELPMSDFSDGLESLIRLDSPPHSPFRWDSPPSSPFVWQFQEVEFVLRQDDDF